MGGTATPPYGYTYSREEGRLLVVPEVGIEEARAGRQDFGTVWEYLTPEERREMLRRLIEARRLPKHRAEPRPVFIPPTELSLALKRGPVAKVTAGQQSR